VPHELVAQKRRVLLLKTATAGLAVLAIAGTLLLLAITGWVTRPLGRLLSVIAEIRKQHSDLSKRVPIVCNDEIGGLSVAFNDMLADLEESQGEIRQHAEKLERKVVERTRELSQAKDAAEAAVLARTAFLANMSHELRTPMTAILGFSENLLESDLPDADRLHAIQTIRRNGDHLLRILNDILDLSKMEAGRLEVELLACSPLQLALDAQSLMSVRTEAKGLTLRVECLSPVPTTIQTDPTRVRQILLNLLGNAIKFTETGQVTLALQLGSAGMATAGEAGALLLCFDVIDTGCGMRPDERPIGCSTPSRRATPPPTADSGAPAWDWRSAGDWRACSAVMSKSCTPCRAGVRTSG
jgi:signal transduction histidine kinase